MLSPTNDGVVDRNQTVSFSGYVFEPNANMWIEAQRVSDDSWEPIRLMQSASSPTSAYHGDDLYSWAAAVVIPAYAWELGVTGYTSRVRAWHGNGYAQTFDMPPTEVVTCLQDSSGWSDFVESCASEESGVVTLRTADYQPADVSVRASSGGVLRHTSAHAFRTTRSESSSTPFTQMEWETSEADRSNWFADIFVENHLATHDSQFLRIPGNTTWQINLSAFYNSLPIASILPRVGSSFRSYRIYDQGACSDVLSWRDIFGLATDDLASTLFAAAASDDDTTNTIRSLRLAAGQMSLTPIYTDTPGRAGNQDGFALYIPVTAVVHEVVNHSVNFDLRIKIGLQASGTEILTNLVSLEVENIAATSAIASIAAAVIPGFIEDKVAAQLPTFSTQIEAALPAITSPIALHRLHSRPEGIEVVLAEVATEPPVELLNTLGLCDRPSVSQSRIGFSGTLFEFTNTRPDPPLFAP